VFVGVFVGVLVGVLLGVRVFVGVGVFVGVFVGVGVGDGEGVGVGVAETSLSLMASNRIRHPPPLLLTISRVGLPPSPGASNTFTDLLESMPFVT